MFVMGYIYAFITVTLWALNIVMAKYFNTNLLPFQLSLGRWGIALIVIFPFAIKSLINLRHLIAKHFVYLMSLGACGVVLANSLLYFATKTLTPTDVGLLQITSPIFLTILSVVFLKDNFNYKQLIGMIVAIIGVFEVLLKGNWDGFSQIGLSIGDLYMFMFSISFAVYSLLQKIRPKEFSQVDLLAITIFAGVIILLPLTYYTEGFPDVNTTDWELMIYLGLFNSILSFLLWNIALTKIGDIKTSMFFYLMPFLTSVLSYFAFGGVLTSFEIYGGILIVCGILIMNFCAVKKKLDK